METEPILPASQLIAKNRAVRNSTRSKCTTFPAVCDAVQRDRAKPEQRRLSSDWIRWHRSTPADATRFVHRTQREIDARMKSNGKERERDDQPTAKRSDKKRYFLHLCHFSFITGLFIVHQFIIDVQSFGFVLDKKALTWSIE